MNLREKYNITASILNITSVIQTIPMEGKTKILMPMKTKKIVPGLGKDSSKAAIYPLSYPVNIWSWQTKHISQPDFHSCKCKECENSHYIKYNFVSYKSLSKLFTSGKSSIL